MCIHIHTYVTMCHLLSAPGEHNLAQVFHTMQEHLRAWALLASSGPGPCGLPGPSWVRPLLAPPGPCRLGTPPGPCGPGHCGTPGPRGPGPWARVGQALVGPLGPCGSGPCGAPGALMGWALVGPPVPLWARPLQVPLGPVGPVEYGYSIYGIPVPLVHLPDHHSNGTWPYSFIGLS